MFDPYGQWLGIPKEQRPINCYQLLGISPRVTDPEAIEEAAEQRTELISRHKEGPHAQACAKLLKEIAQSKNVLTNPAKRKEYDSRMRQQASARASDAVVEAVEEAVIVEEVEEARPSKKPEKAKGLKNVEPAGAKKRLPKKEEKKSSAMLFILLGGAAVFLLLLIGGGVGAYFAFFAGKEPAAAPVAAAPQSKPQPPVTPPTTKSDPPKKADPPQPKPPEPMKQPDPPKPLPPPPPKPPAPKPNVTKLPVPDEAAQAVAEKALKEEFKAEYAKLTPDNKNLPADKTLLAAKFLQPGRENRKDPAAWFVLLREARDLSVQANRPRLAVEAIDEIDRWFVIDPLDMKIKALTAVNTIGSDIITIAGRYRAVLNLIQQAYDVENFDAARRFLDIIETAMKNVQATDLLKGIRTDNAELDGYVKDFQTVTLAKARLVQSPDDPEANSTVGQYLCFFQSKWDEGLPLLAKCADPGLKELAVKELGDPKETKDQLALADGWWGKAKGQRDRSSRNIIKHAKAWYERSGPGTTGEDRTKVINRIKEAQDKEYARISRLLPGSFYGRDPENRVLLLRQGGGTMQSEEAIERGLEWLAKHQSSNGSWSTDKFHLVDREKCKCGDHGQKHDIAGTAFGLMPFLGAGETTRKGGKYSLTIARGRSFLLNEQAKIGKGNFHDNAYENALATTVIVELYGLTKDKSLLGPAQAATNYIVLAQSSQGGWGYSAGSKTPDASVSGWQFTALKAAAFAGLTVPAEAFNRLSAFLDTVADPGGNGYGYNTPTTGAATSAVGLLCREFLSWGPGHPALDKGADFLISAANIPVKDRISMYAVFYITQVAHHLGGRHWEKWNSGVRDLLIELQDKGDDPKLVHQKGSWSPNKDPYAVQGGRLMFTSLALVTLESYYYHIPLYGYRLDLLLD